MRFLRLTIPVILLALLALAPPARTVAAPRPQLQLDSSVLEVRVFPKGRIEAYKGQLDFNYRIQEPEEMSFWDKVKWWFYNQIEQLFSHKAVSTGFKWALWMLTIVVLAYAIVRFIGTDRVLLFVTGRKAPSLAFTTGEEDIHAMDIDAEIASAEQSGDLRRAIRLQYLRSLKLLSDRGRIEWSTSKTNIDYLFELRGSALEEGFRRITRIFEYTWYGEMEIGPSQYQRTSAWFADFDKTVTE
jgi:hypothetical protein